MSSIFEQTYVPIAETYDLARCNDNGIILDNALCAETSRNQYVDVESSPDNEIPFSYFLDGAMQSSKRLLRSIKEYEYLMQLSISCCKLEEGRHLSVAQTRRKTFLVVEDASKQMIQEVKEGGKLESQICRNDIIQTLCNMEIQLVHEIRENGYTGFLLKDGIIEGYVDSDKFHVVGVSKQFSNIYPAQLMPSLERLKKGERTSAVWDVLHSADRTDSSNGYAKAIWYLRLREAVYNKYEHIIRCEMTVENKNEFLFSELIDNKKCTLKEDYLTILEHNKGMLPERINSKLINGISKALIRYAFPVPYHQDSRGRWRTHLYPVYMTEAFCKSQLESVALLNHKIEKLPKV